MKEGNRSFLTYTTKAHISAADSTSEAGEEPKPGAVFELQGGVFDGSPSSPLSCLSSPRYADQGFLASTA